MLLSIIMYDIKAYRLGLDIIVWNIPIYFIDYKMCNNGMYYEH